MLTAFLLGTNKQTQPPSVIFSLSVLLMIGIPSPMTCHGIDQVLTSSHSCRKNTPCCLSVFPLLRIFYSLTVWRVASFIVPIKRKKNTMPCSPNISPYTHTGTQGGESPRMVSCQVLTVLSGSSAPKPIACGRCVYMHVLMCVW